MVVMNRDERRDRTPARPPRRWRSASEAFTAPVDGVVSELPVRAGQQVALDETLAVVTPQEEQQ